MVQRFDDANVKSRLWSCVRFSYLQPESLREVRMHARMRLQACARTRACTEAGGTRASMGDLVLAACTRITPGDVTTHSTGPDA